MASITVQVAFARRVIDFLQREAPTKPTGELYDPYRGWINRLNGEIKKLEAWERMVRGNAR